MPRPISIPVRQAIWRRLLDGQDGPTIAAALGLAPRTVRHLIRRFRQGGQAAVMPASDRCGAATPKPSEALVQAALSLRREHPSWGAGLIRVRLRRRHPHQAPPAARSLQRWFLRAGLAPAPAGRRPAAESRRAARPHEVWPMDAAEQVPLQTGQRVSWLRIAEEWSGGVLWTAVFPPGPLERGPAAGGPGSVAAGVHPLGSPRATPRGQRSAVGRGRRPADRPGVVADRPGSGRGLEPAAAAAGQWRGRAIAGDGQAVGRALRLGQRRGVAAPLGGEGRRPASGVPVRAGPQAVGGVPEARSLGPGVLEGLGAEGLELGRGDGAFGRLRGAAAGGSLRVGVVVQQGSLRRRYS
jgi:hypothetical protein